MRVSIITIARNAEAYMARTIESVLRQDHADIEYIVVDGASTDGTMAVVERYRDRIDRIVSEPDAGISDAWNKGVRMATGDIVALLNAGDTHDADCVSRAVEAIAAGKDFVYGDTLLVDDDGNVKRRNVGRFHLWFYSAGFGFYHPSCFATRALYAKVGEYDRKLRYAMDSDWICRAVTAGARIGKHGGLTRMVDGGVSVQRRFAAYGEHLDALSGGGLRPWTPFLSMIMTALRGMASTARRRLRAPAVVA